MEGPLPRSGVGGSVGSGGPAGSGRAGGEQLCVRLALLSELVCYAQDTLALAVEDARVFMTLHDVLLHGGAGRAAAMDPSLRHPAESAIGAQAADSVPRAYLETAVRLLMSVWSACLVPGDASKEWPHRAPDLPAKCLYAASAEAHRVS
ncbi:hypothetical protein GTY65_28965 [Streptomyces sp. SID8379]|uniref:hypothetical protein n=1 Tax=unclassified Streptomyces TaxID=2593676 RepID=UPI0003602A23|nr:MULTISPECIES: hypothetical protein [unclassified Streptomyces]MYW68074.1 hypothetical protein [Streptomyces sp. SID8379]